jgi:hypothetical protein
MGQKHMRQGWRSLARRLGLSRKARVADQVNGALLVCLLLTSAAWVVSFLIASVWCCDHVALQIENGNVVLTTTEGTFLSRGWHFARGTKPGRLFCLPSFVDGSTSFMGYTTTTRYYTLPMWLLELMLAGGIWARVWLQGKNVGERLCRKCHYDLRGNVSGMCPECGTEIRDGNPADKASG